MKKFFLLALIISNVHAGECSPPDNYPVAGIWLGMSYDALKAAFPKIYNKGNDLVGLKDGVVGPEFSQIEGLLSPTKDHISSLTFYLQNEMNWGYSRMLTRTISDYSLPRKGWEKVDSKRQMIQCEGYQIWFIEDKDRGFLLKFSEAPLN